MKREPRPAIFMEKQLGWAYNLVGVESLGTSKAGLMVLAWLMESQIWHQPVSSGWGRGRKRTMASICLDARHLGLPLHATGAPQAATPVLEPRESLSR